MEQALASKGQPIGEPLDWQTTSCPARWRLDGKEILYRWETAEGASPFGE